jgi:predicted CoA-binding protein
MAFQNPPDAEIAALLNGAKTIALLGASTNPARASHYVMAFLQEKGHRVIPVNPGLAGQTLLGEKVYGHLDEIKEKIHLVDVFRASEHLPGIVGECIAARVPAIWTQLDIVDELAAARAKDAGMVVVMDRCPKIEYPRLGIKGPG